jgi:DNA primase (EC 2.7.7.-)
MELTEKIREAASLVEIGLQFTAVKKRGRKWVGLCPFHIEKTPSFTVDEDKQLYHCFGCGAGGDIFTMVMEKENFNFPEAVKYLAERYHILMLQKQEGSPGEIKLF